MANAADILERAKRDQNGIRFEDLIKLVEAVGYTFRRQKGSHRMYSRPGCPLINLQRLKGNAKPYQVRQVLAIIEEYELETR